MTKCSSVLLLTALLAALACPASSPVLDAARLTRAGSLRRADAIVVATVRGRQVLDDTQTTQNGIRVRLWKVRLAVESIVAGTSRSRQVEAYFYNYDPRVVQNGDFERFDVGDRRVWFLRRDGAVWRFVTDLYETSVPLPHVTLPNLASLANEPPERKIAKLLLTQPKAKGEMAEFARSLGSGIPEALRTAGYAYTAALIDPLLKSVDSAVRRAA